MMPGMNKSLASSSVTVFGIPNCATVKKARGWLAEQAVDYVFHDFKKLGVPADLVPVWNAALGWEKLLNRKGSTWRKLDVTTQAGVIDAATASALILAQPSVIKRPVVMWHDGSVTVGFEPQAWKARLRQAAG